jgi:hypothetical protein
MGDEQINFTQLLAADFFRVLAAFVSVQRLPGFDFNAPHLPALVLSANDVLRRFKGQFAGIQYILSKHPQAISIMNDVHQKKGQQNDSPVQFNLLILDE